MMIHQQDVRRPLGLNREIPEHQLTRILVLPYPLWEHDLGPGVAKISQGLRLIATDIDWSSGHGEEVRERARPFSWQ